ncbi:uncharacterized protein BDZ99DRAFT_115213 [Mytilinidion resinicola]|uniref:Endonuclease/exonuclease/phosphatase domain-containing protein n=1 Tax=Mytilinidion resinicola TaxID=574789 RepID=A0A6A6Y931_9PEZI|nr:uncharacterized protein BDZ99DRAFT_115213 [Mytilinidion resinicola]KAF2805200.1 hypothetical protein BDZ99DRAFT_115213 [Mytilinidion resinicola]
MSAKAGSIEATLAAKLAEPPAQVLDDSHYQPKAQSYWGYEGASWQEHPPTIASGSAKASSICLITWNIDILTGGAEARMAAALEHLESLVSSVPASHPIVIFLQEMGQSDMAQIRASSWIQKRFFLTDIDERSWNGPMYGTTTFVDRKLRVSRLFRVPWVTKFERDGLFVDISLHDESSGDARVLRLCNTHLESLVAEPPVRPLQLASAARYLHEPHVHAALLAGDLNAIQPFDRTLHSENELKDAYLELGGVEDSEEGYTWGQQVPQWMKDKFGCSRMDKVLYCGLVKVTALHRIGVGIKVADDKRQDMRDMGCEEWVTDHYGLLATAELDVPFYARI